MKLLGAVVALVAATSVAPTTAAASSPVTQIVSLLTELKGHIEQDAKKEERTYDKYACWCEATLDRKATDIAAGKKQIEELQAMILKLRAELETHKLDIKQLKKDIAANEESTKEAMEMREKDYTAYQEETTESEQCIGALEAAIKVLAGAGTGRTKFLETLQEAQLMSVVGGVRTALRDPIVTRAVPEADLQLVRHFVESPADFVGGRKRDALGALQMHSSQNPYGDYAPRSGEVQGVLKGMYDSFTSSLEKSNAEEAKNKKVFEELMATKRQELATLKATLSRQELAFGEKTKGLAESKRMLDDTKEQLEADEQFFTETKSSCKTKAQEWAERQRLRTEELTGIGQAIHILGNPQAQAIFKNATTTFLQISPRAEWEAIMARRNQVYTKLKSAATSLQSMALAGLAVEVKAGSHFTKVIEMIDEMIRNLRQEEQDDIKHREKCAKAQLENKLDLKDANTDISLAEDRVAKLQSAEQELNTEIDNLEAAINETEQNLDEMKGMRSEEYNQYLQAIRDDQRAIALLEEAIVALTRFYAGNNEMPASLLEEDPPKNPDRPPETWSTPTYTSRHAESTGIIAILELLKEDLEGEIKLGHTTNSAASANFVADLSSLEATLAAQKKSLAAAKVKLAGLEVKAQNEEEYKGEREADRTAHQGVKASLDTDCGWVETHFDSRRTKRKMEIESLQEARAYLNGALPPP